MKRKILLGILIIGLILAFQNYSKLAKKNALIKGLKEIVSAEQGTYGIYYINMDDHLRFGIKAEETFIAASTIKVPINLYLYEQIASGEVSPKDTLVYKENHYEEGTGFLLSQDFGNEYTIRELSKLSITISDNVAKNMLVDYLGDQNIKGYMTSLVGHQVITNDNTTFSTPRDMATYMTAVLDFAARHPEEGDELLNYLENTAFNDRIPRNLPKEVVVAHKIGTQAGAVHDVGIVFAKDTYILSVMTKDVDESRAPGVIAEISRKIYDFVQGG